MNKFNIVLSLSIPMVLLSSLYSPKINAQTNQGAFYTGNYKNLFLECGVTKRVNNANVAITSADVQARKNEWFNQLFYGTDNQKVYYEVSNDMAYILDANNNDVRSEGMSYGMAIAVQMDKKTEFDKLWKWSYTYLKHKPTSNQDRSAYARKGYFAWQANRDGSIRDANPASDGEEYFATALIEASERWGDGTGIYKYSDQAKDILNVMIHKEDPDPNFYNSWEQGQGPKDSVTNMFNTTEKQVTFVPYGNAATFTDPSYHLPAFYELWARWATVDNQFWADAAVESRQLFKDASSNVVNPNNTSGLMADYTTFGGVPTGSQQDFKFDAWRTLMNVGVDYNWFQPDAWEVTYANKMIDFFARDKQRAISQGRTDHASTFRLNGSPIDDFGTASIGLKGNIAAIALAATDSRRCEFVQSFWDANLDEGQFRYYSNLLAMMAFLHVSGNFKTYLDDDVTPPPQADDYCLGDFNRTVGANGAIVDTQDLIKFVQYFMKPLDATVHDIVNTDGQNRLNLKDFSIFLKNYLQTTCIKKRSHYPL